MSHKWNKKQQDVSSRTFTSVVGKKRKLSCQKAPSTAKRRRGENRFIDDEAVLNGADSGDEESDMEDDTEDFLIDDNSGIENYVSMYRTLEQRDQVNEIEQRQQRFAPLDDDNDEEEEDDEDDNESEDDIDDDVEGDDNDDSKRGIAYPVRITKTELARHLNLLLTQKEN